MVWYLEYGDFFKIFGHQSIVVGSFFFSHVNQYREVRLIVKLVGWFFKFELLQERLQ